MLDEIEQIASDKSEPSIYCPLCKRTFTQESTRKRHYYYCRSKPADTNISRRRSCGACIRAKTRCIWLADTSQKACIRCNKRSAKCESGAVSRRHRISSQGDIVHTVDEALHGDRESQIPENTTDVSGKLIGAKSLQVSTSVKNYQTKDAPLGPSGDGDWDADFGQIDTVRLESMLVETQGVDFKACAFGKVSNGLVDRTSIPSPWTQQLSSLSLFNTRALTKPDQAPLMSLAMRILRSYPFLMLQKGMHPPFMSPLLYSWSESGESRPQQVLISCERLVRMFKSRTEANEGLIWKLIWLEQDRILTEHSNFDRWELLAALQALLIYCLLRLQDVPVGHDVFDISLLATINLVSRALALSIGQRCDCELPDDPALAWREWCFNESRRRTVLMFQIINILVDISTSVSYYSIGGYVLIPLPSTATLWNAQDVEVWIVEFKTYSEQRSIYGVSEAGELTRIEKTDVGMLSSVANWDEWNAEVGDVGTLVMIVAELL